MVANQRPSGETAGLIAQPPGASPVELARTTHGRPFTSAIERGMLLGVQFHPERSGTDGLRLLRNFVELVGAA